MFFSLDNQLDSISVAGKSTDHLLRRTQPVMSIAVLDIATLRVDSSRSSKADNQRYLGMRKVVHMHDILCSHRRCQGGQNEFD